MTRLKPQVGNVKIGQTTDGFTVINPKKKGQDLENSMWQSTLRTLEDPDP